MFREKNTLLPWKMSLTERVASLIMSPSIADLIHGNEHSVYVIDEIDRSLHSDINLWLITKFLENLTPESRSPVNFYDS